MRCGVGGAERRCSVRSADVILPRFEMPAFMLSCETGSHLLPSSFFLHPTSLLLLPSTCTDNTPPRRHVAADLRLRRVQRHLVLPVPAQRNLVLCDAPLPPPAPAQSAGSTHTSIDLCSRHPLPHGIPPHRRLPRAFPLQGLGMGQCHLLHPRYGLLAHPGTIRSHVRRPHTSRYLRRCYDWGGI